MASAEPFLRWAGGKRWLAKVLAPILSTRVVDGTYIEPFLGSGAMFFALQPRKAILSDLNEELITAFREVAWHPKVLVKRLSALPATRRHYEDLRGWRPRSAQNRAVRFIYLNRNCYGGLYRENRQGVFNVPFGGGERSHRRICIDGTLLYASMVLNHPGIEILSCDFEQTIARAEDGDVIYCDPTYRQVTRQHFDRYGKVLFGWKDQERLAQAVSAAHQRGALVIVSNASCLSVRELYSQAGVIKLIRPKGIGPRANSVGQVEYLFVLDPLCRWSEWRRLGPLLMPRLRREVIGDDRRSQSSHA